MGWYLFAAGLGLNLLLKQSIIGDILILVGLGLGILLSIKYVYGKLVKKEIKKVEFEHCGRCGNKLEANSKFCSRCGNGCIMNISD